MLFDCVFENCNFVFILFEGGGGGEGSDIVCNYVTKAPVNFGA